MNDRQRLPNRRNAEIFMIEYEGRRYRATFGPFSDGSLAEIFLDVGKPNAEIQMHADNSAVLASLLLQHHVAPELVRHSISGPIGAALDIWLARSR